MASNPVMLARCTVHLREFDEGQPVRADTNRDSEVNGTDPVLLTRAIAR